MTKSTAQGRITDELLDQILGDADPTELFPSGELLGEMRRKLAERILDADVSAFPSEKHFCSWLALAPNNQISGGNVLRKFRPRKGNRLGQAFRQCAVTVRRSETWLDAKHRRRLARMEKARAVKATAHEIARLVYAMLRDGTEYVERSIADFEKIPRPQNRTHPTSSARRWMPPCSDSVIINRMTKI